jgi:hypothetical protein
MLGSDKCPRTQRIGGTPGQEFCTATAAQSTRISSKIEATVVTVVFIDTENAIVKTLS